MTIVSVVCVNINFDVYANVIVLLFRLFAASVVFVLSGYLTFEDNFVFYT